MDRTEILDLHDSDPERAQREVPYEDLCDALRERATTRRLQDYARIAARGDWPRGAVP